MAKVGGGQIDGGEMLARAQISLSMDEKVKSDLVALMNSLGKIASGSKLGEYFGDVETMAKRLGKAVKDCNQSFNEFTAKEVINSFNALTAAADDGNIKQFAKSVGVSFKTIEETVKRAKSMYGDAVDGMFVEDFKQLFESSESVKAWGNLTTETLTRVIKTLSDTGSIDAYKQKINDLQSSLASMTAERNRLRRITDGDQFQEDQENLQRYKDLLEQATNTFRGFLQTNNLASFDKYGWLSEAIDDDGAMRIRQLFEDVQNGVVSLDDALIIVKREFADFIPKDLDAESRLTGIENTVREIVASLSELKSGGVGAGNVVSQVIGDDVDTSKLNDIKNIVVEFLNSIANGDTSGISQTEQPIRSLLDSINAFLNIDQSKLASASEMLGKLASATSFKADPTQFKNLLEGLTNIGQIPDLSKLTALTNIDLSGLNDMHVSKASLANLSAYLPQLSGDNVDVGKLKAISSIKLDNFNDLKVSKASIENLAKLVEAMSGKTVDAASETSGAVDTEKKTFADVNDLYKAHKTAVEAAVKAEAEKAKTSRALSSDLDKEKASLDGASKSAKQEATFFNQLLSVTKKYAAAQKDIAKLDPEKNANEYQIVSEALQKYKQELDELNQKEEASTLTDAQKATIRQIYEDAAAAVARYKAQLADTSAQKAAKQASEEAAKAAKEAAKEQEKAAKADLNKEQNKDLTKRAEALKQIDELLQKCTVAKDKYYLAGSGKFSEEYKDIERTAEELRVLKQEIESSGKATDDQRRRIKELSAALSDSETAIKTSGNALSRWWSTGLTALGGRLTYAFSMVQLTMKAVQEVKKMISTAVELDTAMNQLQVVTRSSKEDMDAYADSVSKIAKETAQSTKDMIEATTVYARLGYTMDESSVLAKYTAMLQGVGDIDSSAAQDAMTAIVKAFHKNVDDIESIMDKMVVVGNNFPISVSQIAEGMNNAGSALAASGNSLDQSIALLTAANTTVQNISKSSTGLRTIAARIRKTTVELDDLGETIEEAKYQKVIDMLTGKGVKLTENGQYRSTYEILKDIANIWDRLSSMEKAGIAEQLAGSRQQNVFYSIIGQFREAESAMERMKNSSGELQNAFDIYMDSIQAHVNQLTAAFEKLSMTFVNSDFAKGAIDLLRGVLEFVTKIIEAVGPGGLLASIAAVTIGFKALTGTLSPNIIIPIANFFIYTLVPALTALGGAVQTVVPALAGIGATAVGIGAAATAASGLALAVGLVAAGVISYKAAHPSYEDLKKSADEARKSVNDLNSKIEANEARIKEIKAITDDDEFSKASDELRALEEQNDRYREQLSLLQQIADAKDKAVIEKGFSDANEAFSAFMDSPRNVTYNNMPGNYGAPVTVESSNGLGGMLNQIDRVASAEERVRDISKEIADFQEGKTKLSEAEIQHLYDRAQQADEALANARAGLVVFQDQLLDIREKFMAAGAEDSVEKVDEYLRMIADAAGTSDKSFNKFKGDIKSLSYDLEAAVKNGKKLTDSQIKELLRLGYTANDVRSYLTRMAEESAKATADAARSNLADLATIRDELAKTSEAWEEYNKITSSEKGDQAGQMKSAWEKALGDINAGKVDSNSVWGAAKLIFSDEQLASMGYNLNRIAGELSGPFMQALFGGGENSDVGVNFANYIRDNAAALGDAVHVIDNGDGTFKFWYDSLDQLADGLGISKDAATMLLDALDAFGVESMRSTDDVQQIADRYQYLSNTLHDAKAAAKQLADELAHDGANEAQVMDVLSNLRENGLINMSDQEFADIIKSAFNSISDLDDETANPTITADGSPAQAVINSIVSQLEALSRRTYSTTIAATVQEQDAGGKTRGTATGGLGTGAGGTRIGSNASGTKDAPAGDAVVNELGPELIADNGKAYIANGGKPGIASLSKGAIVFTADETKKIFSHHYANIPIRSFATGRAPSATRASIRDRLLSGRRIISAASGYKRCADCGEIVSATTTKCPNCGSFVFVPYTASPVASLANTISSAANTIVSNVDSYISYSTSSGSFDPYAYAEHTSPGIQAKRCADCKRIIPATATRCPYCRSRYFTPLTAKSPQTVNTKSLNQSADNGNGLAGLGGGGSVGHADYGSQSDPTKVDWIAVALNRVQRAVAALQKVATSGFKALSTRANATKEEMGELTKEIEKQQAGYTRYLSEAENVGLSEDLAAKVREGAIEITEYDEATRKLIDEYSEWYEKALDCKYAVEDLHQELAQLYMDNFNNAQTDYENRLSETEHLIEMINKDISMAQTRGYIDSADFYSSLAGNTADQIATLKYELNDLNRYFNEAMESGEIEEGSEAWYEMKQAINEVEESLADANIQLEEYKNKVREINWGYFDYAQERISKISEEANFLINLMSNDKLFQDNGQFNDLGQATAGMHVINYDTYMAQADEYAKEMEKIQRDLANDPYNKTLIERRDELLDLQRQSILNAEAEKNAVKDLVAEGIQLELSALQELIDAYENSLDSAKELYDYQQRVAKQTGDIAALEKQLSAYQNDTSEENRARVQKLQQQLRDAQKSLSDTEYDKSISDQKQLLSDLYNEYEEALNGRLDNVDALMAEIINGANANREAIIQTIISVSDLVGYTVTDGLNNVMHEQFANYSSMFEDVTGIHTALVNIYDLVASMASASGTVKAYAKGGLIDYTGIAAVHGTPGNPEMVLSAADTKMFLEAAAMMRGVNDIVPAIGSELLTGSRGAGGGIQIGTLEVNIPIGRVLDYNDMIAQMQKDPKFDRLINAITLDRATGKSNLSKYGVKFS